MTFRQPSIDAKAARDAAASARKLAQDYPHERERHLARAAWLENRASLYDNWQDNFEEEPSADDQPNDY